MTDDLFTEPPWSSDVAGRIYAVNGRAGQNLVATLHERAPAKLLAAAPALLQALEDSMDCLELEFHRSGSGAHRNAVLDARNGAVTAVAHAKTGYPASVTQNRLWAINALLPPAEGRANGRLLDAAAELRAAATKAFAALAGHIDNTEVVSSLHSAIIRANY